MPQATPTDFCIRRRAQPGAPVKGPASSAAAAGDIAGDIADGRASGAEPGMAQPSGSGGRQLTKRERARLEKQAKRRQRKAEKRQENAARQDPQRLPPPPAAPVDKVCFLLLPAEGLPRDLTHPTC